MFNAETSTRAVRGPASAALSRLGAASADQVRAFWRSVERFGAGASLAGPRGAPREAVILSGWACEMCLLPDGRRQVFSLFLPGDLVSIAHRPNHDARSLVALTRLELVDTRHFIGAEGRFGLDAGLLNQTEAANRLFDQMLRLGQLTAQERLLHLFLELYERLDAVGLVKNDTYRLPLTQEVVADSLGLSIVHINRTLKQLRRQELIILKAGHITLANRRRLATLACYAGRRHKPNLDLLPCPERPPQVEPAPAIRSVAGLH